MSLSVYAHSYVRACDFEVRKYLSQMSDVCVGKLVCTDLINFIVTVPISDQLHYHVCYDIYLGGQDSTEVKSVFYRPKSV